jgi:alkylation response protein AidB-like acyl-CoA dehydrogenase
MTHETLTNEAEVRAAVRAWIDDNFDLDLSLSSWLERLVDSGWAVPSWSSDWFGKGLPNALAAAALEEFRWVDAPGPPLGLARMLAAPTLVNHGTEDQKRRFIRAILVGEEAWCQLFSEPSAGSDLASLQTRARRDGDHFVINGQKVWTSGAAVSDYGMLLARTDVDVPKHRGITYFALPMDQEGVDVRPLREMTGEALFAEVFLTDVRVPLEDVIGEVNGGWAVAMTTLAHERTGLGSAASMDFAFHAPGGRRYAEMRRKTVGQFIGSDDAIASSLASAGAMRRRGVSSLVSLAKELGRDTDPLVRQRLAELYATSKVNAWNGLRARQSRKAGKRQTPEASLGKLLFAEVTRQWRDTAALIAGAQSLLAEADGPMDGYVAFQALSAPSPAIYGGSDQIQRNILGERLLGLPRETDPSRELPFRDIRSGTLTPRAEETD